MSAGAAACVEGRRPPGRATIDAVAGAVPEAVPENVPETVHALHVQLHSACSIKTPMAYSVAGCSTAFALAFAACQSIAVHAARVHVIFLSLVSFGGTYFS